MTSFVCANGAPRVAASTLMLAAALKAPVRQPTGLDEMHGCNSCVKGRGRGGRRCCKHNAVRDLALVATLRYTGAVRWLQSLDHIRF